MNPCSNSVVSSSIAWKVIKLKFLPFSMSTKQKIEKKNEIVYPHGGSYRVPPLGVSYWSSPLHGRSWLELTHLLKGARGWVSDVLNLSKLSCNLKLLLGEFGSDFRDVDILVTISIHRCILAATSLLERKENQSISWKICCLIALLDMKLLLSLWTICTPECLNRLCQICQHVVIMHATLMDADHPLTS